MVNEKKKDIVCACIIALTVGFMASEILRSNYKVLPADTWNGIAEKFDVNSESLASYNDRRIDDQLCEDQKQDIASVETMVEQTIQVEQQTEQIIQTEHLMQTEQIYEIHTHKVIKGDTAYSIAKRYSITIEELCLYNKIEDPNVIYLGQDLIIKKHKSTDSNGSNSEPVVLKSSNVELTTDSKEENSLYNIKMACEKLDGYILYPGETFSWFDVIGAADESQGYKVATVIADGKTSYAAGGGVCLVSTALMQAARASGCEILERHDHGLPVSYAKPGDEATVSFGWLDLKFQNTSSEQAIIFACKADGQTVTIETFA